MAWLSYRDHLFIADSCTRHRLAFTFGTLLMLTWISSTFGQDTVNETVPCGTPADTNAIDFLRARFSVSSWMSRGECIRETDEREVGRLCSETLEKVLKSLSEVRKLEYSAAAGVLSLLPTIGALLGAPTNEIWRLMSINPFGGVLVWPLSFGGAVIPSRLEDYEHVTYKRNMAISSVVWLVNKHRLDQVAQKTVDDKLGLLVHRIRQRIDQKKSVMLPRKLLVIGLCGLLLLLCATHAVMGIIEQGGIIPWFCARPGWVHIWYIWSMSDICPLTCRPLTDLCSQLY